jgi:hypothetical protein
MYYLIALTLFLLPLATYAQEGGSLQGLIAGILGFINGTVIPLVLGLAFLVFLINAVRFFIIGGSSTEGQENARNLALYGIGAFVLILSLWGMVNFLAEGFGFNNEEAPTADYLPDAFERENIRQSIYCQNNPGSIDCR